METAVEVSAGVDGTRISIITVDHNRDVETTLYRVTTVIGAGLAIVAYIGDHQVTAAQEITGVNGADISIITAIVDDAIGTS